MYAPPLGERPTLDLDELDESRRNAHDNFSGCRVNLNGLTQASAISPRTPAIRRAEAPLTGVPDLGSWGVFALDIPG